MYRIRKGCIGHRGSALVLSLVFLVIFSALAAALAGVSGANLQIANNQRAAGQALSSAHSGLDILRYYLRNVSIPTGVPASRMDFLAQELQNRLAGVENMTVSYDATHKTITVPAVELCTGAHANFSATLRYGKKADGTLNYGVLDTKVTGRGGDLSKQVKVSFLLTEIGNPIFDYGIATRGPLLTQGSVEVETFNEKCWADVYIESPDSSLALEMTGKSSIAGKVYIPRDPAITDVLIGNSSSVFGAQGSAAMEYVHIETTYEVPFPAPDCSLFAGYVETTWKTGDATSGTLRNIRIPPNSNLNFSNVTINGVLYVQQPNSLSFTGNVTVNGIIVAEGDVDNPSEANLLDFGGNATIRDVSALSSNQFGALTEKTGTCILAPGFRVGFRGNSTTIGGVVAASGVEFVGNASGMINGTVINYSSDRMELQGNTNLTFNRSGADKIPAGFQPRVTLQFVDASYSECL